MLRELWGGTILLILLSLGDKTKRIAAKEAKVEMQGFFDMRPGQAPHVVARIELVLPF